MNAILDAWNRSEHETAIAALLNCCAAQRWAEELASMRPIATEKDLFTSADQVWGKMQEADWMQAFRAHPRIGDRKLAHASAQSTTWSRQEQASTETAHAHILAQLAEGNLRYENLFCFTYIVCATGKSAEEMLSIMKRRLKSDRLTELREAAEQQRQITQIRLKRWLQV